MTGPAEYEISLEDLIEEQKSEIEEEEDLLEAAESQGEAAEEIPADEDAEDIRNRLEPLRGGLRALEAKREEWGEVTWTIIEPTFGAIMMAQDEVAQASRGKTEVQPGGGFAKVVTLRRVIQDVEGDAPDDPADYPYHVGQLLYEAVDAYITNGEVGLGNLSGEED